MISIGKWIPLHRVLIATNILLIIIVACLTTIIVHQLAQPDITPQKLDTVQHQHNLKKGKTMSNRYRWQCELIRVVDGDTLEAWITLDFGVKLSAKLRLQGVDAPEIHTVKKNTKEYRKGILAKEFVEARFKVQGKDFWAETDGKRPGKYGRFIVNVLMPSGEYLDKLLVDAGHAVRKKY